MSEHTGQTPCEKCGGATCSADARCCHDCAVTVEITVCGSFDCGSLPPHVLAEAAALRRVLAAAQQIADGGCRSDACRDADPCPACFLAVVLRAEAAALDGTMKEIAAAPVKPICPVCRNSGVVTRWNAKGTSADLKRCPHKCPLPSPTLPTGAKP